MFWRGSKLDGCQEKKQKDPNPRKLSAVVRRTPSAVAARSCWPVLGFNFLFI